MATDFANCDCALCGGKQPHPMARPDEHNNYRSMIKCTACGFELPPAEYLNHRRHECPGSGQDALAAALASIALELEIGNVMKHGTMNQLLRAEARRSERKG